MAKPVTPAQDLQDLLDTIPPPEPRTDLGNVPDDPNAVRAAGDDPESPEPSDAPPSPEPEPTPTSEPVTEPEPTPATPVEASIPAGEMQLRTQLAALERENQLIRAGAQPATPAPLLPFQITEGDINTFLQGGPQAAQIMQAVLETAVRQAVDIAATGLRQEYQQARQTETQGQSLQQQFYTQHADLQPYARIVGSVAQEVYTAQPGLNASQLLAETASRTRVELKKMGITPTRAASAAAGRCLKPARAESGGGSRGNGRTTLNAVEKDVLDLVYRG